jgi:hypothetical protein
MDMSFQRHASFDLGKERPDDKSGQPLDYARLIALAQKGRAQTDLAGNNAMPVLAENSDRLKASQDGDIEKRIALIAGAGQSRHSGARSTRGCGAFLERSANTGCGPDQHDEHVKSKLPVYPDHLANGKASDV